MLKLLALSFLMVVNSLSAKEIMWYRPDFPPANFVDGLMEGLGYNDQTHKYMLSKLPQYKHADIVSSYKRALHNIKHTNGCILGLYKTTERQDYLIYSEPNLLTFPNGVVIKEKDLTYFKQYIGKKGFISIKKLFADKSLIAGIADGRSYAGTIDTLLKSKQIASQVVLRSGENVFTGLLNMLDKNRLDFMFGFPEELEYYTSLGILSHKMKFIPIQEMPKYEKSYIACSKNDWGQATIKDIDQVIIEQRTSPQYLSFYEFWLDFDSKKRHHQLSLDVFGAANENIEN